MYSTLSRIRRTALKKARKMGAIGQLLTEVGTDALKNTAGGVSSALNEQIGYGIGNLTGYNDSLRKDQLNQQDALSGIQQKYNFASMDKAYEMNSPEMQVKRLKDAGLNPALMYSGSGAGGSTVNAPTASGGNASDESSRRMNAIAAQGMALQNAKVQSEIGVNKATEASLLSNVPKNAADAANKGQDTENKKEEFKGIGLRNEMQKIQNDIAAANKDNVIQMSALGVDRLMQELVNLKTNNRLTEADIRKTESTILNIIEDTLVKKANVNLSNAQIKAIANNISVQNEQLVINRESLANALEIAGLNNEGKAAKEINGVLQVLSDASKGGRPTVNEKDAVDLYNKTNGKVRLNDEYVK